ncbi:hypothetical protein C8D88_102687 [Lentzea atacamensis]|uniref:Uncharacterized protein n=1 Tax=Lentzea atacamensis TaxID=531938 RepID=A0A316IAP0_9PSEU|nr:hypothetical protein C8D88_102687 [Lentzea atacamensis]
MPVVPTGCSWAATKPVATLSACLSRPDWEALPQSGRDEIGTMVETGGLMSAVYRLRDLDHNRLDTFDHTLMVVYRDSLRAPAAG